MSVKLCESAQEFLDETLALRTLNALSLNMISSVATSVARGDRSYDQYFWWVLKDEFGKVVGLAMRAAPHAMVLPQMPITAVVELADQVILLHDDLPEIGGPNEAVDQFMIAYKAIKSPGSKRKAELSHQELLYELRGLRKPEVSGTVRTATKGDFEHIHDWYLAFGDEAGILLHDTIESIEDGLKRASLFLWIDGGKIVSIAGHAPVVEIPRVMASIRESALKKLVRASA